MGEKKSKTKLKVGADGLTKHQCFRKLHREDINAANARRIRERRAKERKARNKKDEKRSELETGIPDAMSPPGDAIVDNSDSSDKELDRELAVLDALDEYQKVHDEADALFIALEGKWDFEKGWHANTPFTGSEAETRLANGTFNLGVLLGNLKVLLRSLPVEAPMWKETLDMIIWTSGTYRVVWDLFDTLSNDEE